jgi:primosomal protein N''
MALGVGALKGAVTGLAGIAGGIIGSGARKREQKAAQAEFNRNKARMENADTSNLAMNQENTMEDLTVNTQQADFIAQQQNQGMANTMDSLQGAAGGSGIAALAQSLSNQQTANAQAASASIGQQEAGNQMAERRMAGQLQNQELQGAYASRAAEKDKTDTMLGMSQNRLGAANAARDAATSSIVGGVGGLMGSGLDVLGGADGMVGHG